MKKRILITGASRGIGKVIAFYLSGKGFNVVGTTRKPAKLPEDIKKGIVNYIAMDVTSKASIKKGIKDALRILGGIDILINNAGISHVTPFEEISEQDARKVMETNFFGLASVSREVIPILRKSGNGLIINISSLAGFIGVPFQSFYSASKYAIEGLSDSLRKELYSQGIKVVVVEPGNVNTGVGDHRLYPDKVSGYYKKEYQAVRNIIEKTVEDAESPEVIAKLVYRIIRKRNPKTRYPGGSGSGSISMIMRMMPQKISEFILKKYYKL